jgi:hypothetical protein
MYIALMAKKAKLLWFDLYNIYIKKQDTAVLQKKKAAHIPGRRGCESQLKLDPLNF